MINLKIIRKMDTQNKKKLERKTNKTKTKIKSSKNSHKGEWMSPEGQYWGLSSDFPMCTHFQAHTLEHTIAHRERHTYNQTKETWTQHGKKEPM